jgi:hypothetical protein
MARLPTPGGDENVWGNLLNEFLGQSHEGDGRLKTSALASAGSEIITNKGLAGGYAPLDGNGQVPSSFLPPSGSVGDASSGQKGVVQLGGDLAGSGSTADTPIISDGAITDSKVASGANISKSKLAPLSIDNSDIAAGAAIATSKIAGLDATLSSKATDSATVHKTGSETIDGVKTFSSAPVVPDPTLGTEAANKASVDNVAGSGSTPDADNDTKGKIQLAGDLAGSADSPTVPALANKVDMTIATNKGDMLAATGSGAIDRLAVGSDNLFLMADSSQTTGLRWDNPASLQRHLIYDKRSPDGTQEVYAACLDGTQAKRLTHDPTYHSWWARFSPDGTRILFRRTLASTVDPNSPDIMWNGTLWVMNADGSNQRQIFNASSIGTDGAFGLPHWHPNGRDIYFCAGAQPGGVPGLGNTMRLAKIKDDGSGLTFISVTYSGFSFTSGLFDPTLSPDGEWVAFSAGAGAPITASIGDLYKVPAEGGEAIRLTTDGGGSTYHNDPMWSANGSKIIDYVKVSSDALHWQIQSRNADGSGVVNLTDSTPIILISRGAISPGDGRLYFAWFSDTQTVPRVASLRDDATSAVASDFINLTNDTFAAYPDIWYPKITSLTASSGSTGTSPASPVGFLSTNKVVANTTAETLLLSATIPGNYLRVGSVFHLTASGIASTKASPVGTLTLRVRLGTASLSGNAILTFIFTPDANAASKIWKLDADVACQAIGTAGSVMPNGIVFNMVAAGQPLTAPVILLANTFNTTVDNLLEVTAQWATADSGNTLTTHIGLIKATN